MLLLEMFLKFMRLSSEELPESRKETTFDIKNNGWLLTALTVLDDVNFAVFRKNLRHSLKPY